MKKLITNGAARGWLFAPWFATARAAVAKKKLDLARAFRECAADLAKLDAQSVIAERCPTHGQRLRYSSIGWSRTARCAEAGCGYEISKYTWEKPTEEESAASLAAAEDIHAEIEALAARPWWARPGFLPSVLAPVQHHPRGSTWIDGGRQWDKHLCGTMTSIPADAPAEVERAVNDIIGDYWERGSKGDLMIPAADLPEIARRLGEIPGARLETSS